MTRWFGAAIALAMLLALLAATVVWLNLRGEEPLDAASSAITPALVERGAALARAGNCAACHTARGGARYAGGRGIETPFGTVYSSNLTPDATQGLGAWSAAEFRRALKHGRSRDGRLLYPAFPYPNFTLVSREDADALWAYLRSVPAVEQPNRDHELRWPYSTQWALAVWRALFFEAEAFMPEPARGEAWNRGAYLVRGLGHCNACHAARNFLGATAGPLELGGGLIPVQNWYAPSLNSTQEAGVADWREDDIVALLRTGQSARGSALGPMAEVVYASTQHLAEADLRAMAAYLKSLPGSPRRAAARSEPPEPGAMARGENLYADHCADCHGPQGQGAEGQIAALAGNRSITLDSPANLIRVILAGGFPPTTAGQPRPYGMPPFAQTLKDDEIAALATYIRNAWGHAASPVTALEVQRLR
jgi:mono/diheme cytochrome c family protein